MTKYNFVFVRMFNKNIFKKEGASTLVKAQEKPTRIIKKFCSMFYQLVPMCMRVELANGRDRQPRFFPKKL